MRLSEIERIPASDYTGAGTLIPGLTRRSLVRGLRPLTGNLLYQVTRYGDWEINLGIWAQEQRGLVRHVGELGVTRASHMPKPAYRVNHITVHRQYRGQGLARALYQLYFDQVGQALVAGDSQTPGGRLMWKLLYQDPRYEVIGLIGFHDELFDEWDDSPEFQKWIDDLMAIGGEHLGVTEGGFHWFAVPLREMRRELNILKGFQLYGYQDSYDNMILTTMLARKRGTQ